MQPRAPIQRLARGSPAPPGKIAGRTGSLHSGPQPPRIGMNADLRGRHRGMADQLGDLVDGGAGVSQVAGHRVPQLMRGYPAGKPGPPGRGGNQSVDGVRRHRRPAGSPNKFTTTKSPAAACGTPIRSNS